jgi:uncharacterized membrane protein
MSVDAIEQVERAERRVRQVELLISTILRTGVVVSLVTIVVGMVLSFLGNPAYTSSAGGTSALSANAQFPHTLAAVFSGLAAGNGEAIAALGILVLIATPVVRVLVSVFTFVYQRDRVFTVITIVVFLLLLTSILLGTVER